MSKKALKKQQKEAEKAAKKAEKAVSMFACKFLFLLINYKNIIVKQMYLIFKNWILLSVISVRIYKWSWGCVSGKIWTNGHDSKQGEIFR